MNAAKISALFERRGAKNIPPVIVSKLEEIAGNLRLTAEDLHTCWEELTFQHAQWSSCMFPPDFEALEALRKKLSTDTTRREKRKQATFAEAMNLTTSTAALEQVLEPSLGSQHTTPPAKKRTEPPSKVSPQETKREKLLPQASATKKVPASTYNEHLGPIGEVVDAAAGPNNEIVLLGATSHLMDEDSPKLYMHSTIEENADVLRERVEEFGRELLNLKKLVTSPKSLEGSSTEEGASYATAFDPVGSSVPGRNMLYCGRILCEAEDGKLNRDSILLEGDKSIRVRLDFSKHAAKFSVFPGQVVVVEGALLHDQSGLNRFMVEKFYDGFCDEKLDKVTTGKRVWIASGAYTSQNDLSFANLEELIARVTQAGEKPDVLVLLGPFVDGNHPDVVSGELNIKTGNEVAEKITLEDLLYFITSKLTSQILPLNNRIQIVLVPSVDDATHPHASFPQPPLSVELDGLSELERKRFLSLPNPCTFALKDPGLAVDAGVTFGVSNLDALFHFMEEGSPSAGYALQDNLSRVASHMLLQRSYYPIVPANPEACVDVQQERLFRLDAGVDFLVCPSKLNPFCKEATCDGRTLCVNPGRAIPGKKNLTLVKLSIHAMNGDSPVCKNVMAEFFEIGPGVVAQL